MNYMLLLPLYLGDVLGRKLLSDSIFSLGGKDPNCSIPGSSLSTWELQGCKCLRNMTLSYSIGRYSCVYTEEERLENAIKPF